MTEITTTDMTTTNMSVIEITTNLKPLQTKRRTFKEVAADAYAKGWNEGLKVAREEFEAAYNLLSENNSALRLENSMLQERLDNLSLRKLAWSRITDLFKGDRHVL